jgi:hypothetical protein
MDGDRALPTEAPDERWRRRPLFFGPVIVAFVGFLAAVIPEWSARWALANAALVAAAAVFMAVIVFGGGYRVPKLRVAYTISQFDLLCFFMTVTAWRGLGSGPVSGFVLFGILVITAVVAHVFRRAVLQELSQPQTRFGLLHAGLGSIGAGAAALLGYSVAQGLPDGALGIVVFVVAIYVVVPVHALWVGAEDPDWQPARRARRRRA